MRAGESADKRASDLKDAARQLRAKADQLEAMAAHHEDGAQGERELLSLVRGLDQAGYLALPDVGVVGRSVNIDLLLVGPAGVFVVDAKRWTGTIHATSDTIRQNGSDRRAHVEGVRAQASAVWEALQGCVTRVQVPVLPVLAFVGPGLPESQPLIDFVQVLRADCLDAYVRSAVPVLTNVEVQQALQRLQHVFTPRTSSVETGDDTGRAIAPNEAIVFVTSWNKYGKRRIYVRDENGNQGGYLDLVEGRVAGTSASANAVLARLMYRYSADAEPGEQRAIDRFLTWFRGQPSAPSGPPLVVGSYWRKSGARRLYVDYLHSNGEQAELGWVEIEGTRRVHAAHPGWAEVIRYCGQRFEATKPTEPATTRA